LTGLDKGGGSPDVKSKPATAKNGRKWKPMEIVKVSNVSIPIYVHSSIIPQRDE
jgi:hypothetical protein